MAHDPRAFFTLAQLAMKTTQKELGEALGISRRTAQRYSEHGVPSPYIQRLAQLVHPHNRELASEIARHAGATLVSLGLELPAPDVLPLPAPAPPSLPDGVVDAVVCAAAEAADEKPADVRPMLLAAFARAREIGVDTAFVERVLRAQASTSSTPEARSPDGAAGRSGRPRR